MFGTGQKVALFLMLLSKVNTGRFRNLKTLADYGVERLKHIDIRNPFSTFRLAGEFYEIIKEWDESLIEEFITNEGNFGQGATMNLQNLYVYSKNCDI